MFFIDRFDVFIDHFDACFLSTVSMFFIDRFDVFSTVSMFFIDRSDVFYRPFRCFLSTVPMPPNAFLLTFEALLSLT
jgi:hypothetical protein